MNTKRTILSEKESNLIEEIIAKYSTIVNFEQIYSILEGKITRQGTRNLVNKLSKNGWLVRIKKGLYFVAGLESRGSISIHYFKIAQILVKDSYISCEAALQHHGMFDQSLKVIVSISLKRLNIKEIQNTQFKFIKIKRDNYYGWQEDRIENYLVKIAIVEKALLDLLNFERNIYYVDLVFEILKEYHKDINFNKLIEFSKKQSITVQRIVGFLMDKLLLNSTEIYNSVKNKKNCSYMTNDSEKFNSKWRLYFHRAFDER